MRRPLRWLTWTGLAAALVGASAVQFYTRGEGLARSRLIDEEHFDRVQVGMRLEEADAVLGGPPGRFETRRTALLAPPRDSGPLPDQRAREEWWSGDQGFIRVYFTRQGTVGRTVFWRVGPAPGRPLGEKVRRGFQRLAEWAQDRLECLRGS